MVCCAWCAALGVLREAVETTMPPSVPGPAWLGERATVLHQDMLCSVLARCAYRWHATRLDAANVLPRGGRGRVRVATGAQ